MPDKEFTIILYGDVNGDGKINAIDALAIVKNKLKKKEFENEYFVEAGRVSNQTRKNDSTPNAVDALAIIKHSLKKREIEQYYDVK